MGGDPLSVLFTDIEGSTELWATRPDEMSVAMEAHDSELTRAIVEAGGRVLSNNGDGFSALFITVRAAVVASIDLQSSLARLATHFPVALAVRIGIHSGSPTWLGGEPRGQIMNEASRVMSAGHGGQIFLSGSAAIAVASNLPPGAALRDLGMYRLKGLIEPTRLVQLSHPRLPERYALPRAIPISDPLGQERGSLIDRVEELRALELEVRAGSVTVLVGTAGVGKTRLAVEVGRRLSTSFAEGAQLIELATILDPTAVAEACAAALGVRGRLQDGVLPSIVEGLRHRHQLVVFDNCEHVSGEVRQIVQHIRSACPGIAFLLTSREHLAIDDEVSFRLMPLPITRNVGEPDSQSVAETFFLERAHAVQPELDLTRERQSLVSHIVWRLDGLPLALELAASQLRHSTLAELHQTVIGGRLLDTRLEAPHYVHGTLERAIGWSYERLHEDARDLFEACSVFAGPFSVDAAAALNSTRPVTTVIAALNELVRTSLVDELVQPHQRLFRLLDSARAFAGQRLAVSGQSLACRGRLIQHYVALASEAGLRLRTADEQEWVQTVANEFPNIRYAQQLAIELEDVNAAMELTTGLHDWALYRMWYELTGWALSALELPGARSHDRYLEVTATAIYGLWAHGRRDEAHVLSQQALEFERANALPACVLLRDALASLALYERRIEDAMRWTTEWLELSRRRNEDFRMARALYTATLVHMLSGDIETAAALGRDAMRSSVATGSPTVLAFAHFAHGLLARRADPDWAARCFERATTLGDGVRNDLVVGLAQAELARLNERESPTKALTAMRNVLQRWATANDLANQMLTIRRIALLLGTLGHEEEAITLLSAIQHTSADGDAEQPSEAIARLRERIDTSRAIAAASFGKLLSHGRLVDYAFNVIDRVLSAETWPGSEIGTRTVSP
jgi:predicted ATPase/class 3 adenylate cyclase